MKIHRFGAGAVVVASVVMLVSVLSPAEGRVQDEPQEHPQQVLDQEETLTIARAHLLRAFQNAGYSERDALVLSERSMDILKGLQVDPFEPLDPVEADAILDPDSDPMILIARVRIESGKSREEAYRWATLAYITASRIEDDPSLAGLDEGCLAFPVTVSYCETVGGLNRKKYKVIWLDAGCFADVIAPCLPPTLPACNPPNVPTMDIPTKFNPAQCTLGFADGRCVSIDIPDPSLNPAQGAPCAIVVGCECFDENYIQQNCGTIVVRCCPISGCIQGCPNCP